MTEFKLGRLAGLNLSAVPSAIVGLILLWIALGGIAIGLLRFSFGEAMGAGLLATVLHWLSDTLHQLGHAWVARQTGYPMIGIRYWGVLSTSVYPADEKPLPAAIHLRRALGGPAASLIVVLVAAAIFLVVNSINASGMVWWIALFFFFENAAAFFAGSLMPLGFTDGSTLLHWWGKR